MSQSVKNWNYWRPTLCGPTLSIIIVTQIFMFDIMLSSVLYYVWVITVVAVDNDGPRNQCMMF